MTKPKPIRPSPIRPSPMRNADRNAQPKLGPLATFKRLLLDLYGNGKSS